MPNIKARITNKHDTEANWALAENFKPLAGEVIVYDVDSNHAYPRFKVGDGKTLVSALPFSTDVLTNYVTETELASALNETTSAINKTIATIDDEVATHVAAINNPHSVTKSQIGLGNVDNTSDANKPISTAAQEVFDSIETNLNNLPDIYEKKENLSATVDNVKLNEQFTLPEGVYDKIVNNKNFTLVCNSQDGECVKFSAWFQGNFLGTDLLTSFSALGLANMSSDIEDDSLGVNLISISKQSNSALAYIKQYVLAFDGGTFWDLTAGAAIADIDGNNIPNTYAKKTEIPDIPTPATSNNGQVLSVQNGVYTLVNQNTGYYIVDVGTLTTGINTITADIYAQLIDENCIGMRATITMEGAASQVIIPKFSPSSSPIFNLTELIEYSAIRMLLHVQATVESSTSLDVYIAMTQYPEATEPEYYVDLGELQSGNNTISSQLHQALLDDKCIGVYISQTSGSLTSKIFLPRYLQLGSDSYTFTHSTIGTQGDSAVLITTSVSTQQKGTQVTLDSYTQYVAKGEYATDEEINALFS